MCAVFFLRQNVYPSTRSTVCTLRNRLYRIIAAQNSSQFRQTEPKRNFYVTLSLTK